MRARGKGERRLVSLLEITRDASNVELILQSHVSDLLLFLSYFDLYRVSSFSHRLFVRPFSVTSTNLPWSNRSVKDRKTTKANSVCPPNTTCSSDISSSVAGRVCTHVHSYTHVLSPGIRRVKRLDRGFVSPAYLSSPSIQLSRSCSRVEPTTRVLGKRVRASGSIKWTTTGRVLRFP